MLNFVSETISVAWFFMLGTCIGSFLNVVIYRIPAGRSLIGPSCCPNCDSEIKWYDNIPIFGWLGLQGRCRNCSIDISARYPRVEFIVGAVFATIAVGDVALGLANWPGIQAPHYRGFTWHLFDPHAGYLFVYVGHVVLMSVLFAVAMIEFDRHPIPIGILVFLGIALFLSAVIGPALPDGSDRKLGRMFALMFHEDGVDLQSVRIRAVGVLYGLVVGPIIAWAFESPSAPESQQTVAGRLGIATIFAIVGGWLGVFTLTCITIWMAVLVRGTELFGGFRESPESDTKPAEPPKADSVDKQTNQVAHESEEPSESSDHPSDGAAMADPADADDVIEEVSACWPRLPLGFLFLATWIVLLTAGLIGRSAVSPYGWEQRFWIGIFTAAAIPVFYRYRLLNDMRGAGWGQSPR